MQLRYAHERGMFLLIKLRLRPEVASAKLFRSAAAAAGCAVTNDDDHHRPPQIFCDDHRPQPHTSGLRRFFCFFQVFFGKVLSSPGCVAFREKLDVCHHVQLQLLWLLRRVVLQGSGGQHRHAANTAAAALALAPTYFPRSLRLWAVGAP